MGLPWAGNTPPVMQTEGGSVWPGPAAVTGSAPGPNCFKVKPSRNKEEIAPINTILL